MPCSFQLPGWRFSLPLLSGLFLLLTFAMDGVILPSSLACPPTSNRFYLSCKWTVRWAKIHVFACIDSCKSSMGFYGSYYSLWNVMFLFNITVSPCFHAGHSSERCILSHSFFRHDICDSSKWASGRPHEIYSLLFYHICQEGIWSYRYSLVFLWSLCSCFSKLQCCLSTLVSHGHGNQVLTLSNCLH